MIRFVHIITTVLFAGLLFLGCGEHPVKNTAQKKSHLQYPDETPILIQITSEQNRYKATWGEGGGVKPPSIMLKIILKNNSSSEFTLSKKKVILQLYAQQSKREETIEIPLKNKKGIIGSKEKQVIEYEAGNILTQLASGFMKGDTIVLKALLSSGDSIAKKIIISDEIQISIFVPEG